MNGVFSSPGANIECVLFIRNAPDAILQTTYLKQKRLCLYKQQSLETFLELSVNWSHAALKHVVHILPYMLEPQPAEESH